MKQVIFPGKEVVNVNDANMYRIVVLDHNDKLVGMVNRNSENHFYIQWLEGQRSNTYPSLSELWKNIASGYFFYEI